MFILLCKKTVIDNFLTTTTSLYPNTNIHSGQHEKLPSRFVQWTSVVGDIFWTGHLGLTTVVGIQVQSMHNLYCIQGKRPLHVRRCSRYLLPAAVNTQVLAELWLIYCPVVSVFKVVVSRKWKNRNFVM